MYIIINDILGKKTIDLSYPVKGREIATITMLSNNVQYWLQGSIEVLLKTSKKILLNKTACMDKGLNSLIGMELRYLMLDSRNDILQASIFIC